MKTVTIQFLSNLFVREKSFTLLQKLVKPSAPILTLLGNVGEAGCAKTQEFLQWTDREFDKVFWVPGPLEYSSPKTMNLTWRERADQTYKDLENWGVKRTTFCQKLEMRIPNTDLRLFASPLWGRDFNPQGRHRILDWNGKSERAPLKDTQYAELQYNELMWLGGKLYRLPKEETALVLSHSVIPHPLFKPYRVFSHLYGTEPDGSPRVISGGRNPWVGLNMVGSPFYRKDATIHLCAGDRVDR